MSRYMLQHKSFSTLLFLCNMVLFGGLFSIPVFFLHYALVIGDRSAVTLEAFVLIPAICLAYHFARQKEKTAELDSVVIDGGDIIVGAGLLAVRPGPRPTRTGPPQLRIHSGEVERVELKRMSGSGSLGSFYELVLSSVQGTRSIPLNDWVLRNLKLTEIDSRGRYVTGRHEAYPGRRFVSEVYSLLKDVPWKVTSYHTGRYDTHETDYEFRGIADPWGREQVIGSPSRKRRQLLAAIVALCAVALMGFVGSVYCRHQKAKMELQKRRAMEQLMNERKRSHGL